MKFRNYIIVSVLCILQFCQLEVRAQCPVSSVVLNTQADVDNFLINFPNCVELNVSLHVDGADISNLNGLSNLEALNGGASFFDNTLLTDFTGLNNVEQITGLTILGNSSIVNFEGLSQLSQITGGLQVEFNIGLQNFNGLELLDTITGPVFIYNNPNLTDITALQNLEFIGGDLTISTNPLLSFCTITGICDYLSNPNGSIMFFANGTGCSSQQEIENNCSTSTCGQDNIWLGPTGGSWHNQNHWSLSEIPSDCHHVIVPAGSHLKVLSGMTAEALTFTVHESVIFETEPTAILNIMID